MTVHPPILQYIVYVRRTAVGEALDGRKLGTGTESRCGLGIHRLVRGDEQAFASAKLALETQHRLVRPRAAHGDAIDIRHRQGETRTLEKSGRVIGVRQGGDAQARAIRQLRLGLHQGLAKFSQ